MAHDHVGLYQELVKGERECLVQSAFQSDALENAQQVDQSTFRHSMTKVVGSPIGDLSPG
jgi:hypothetical protein